MAHLTTAAVSGKPMNRDHSIIQKDDRHCFLCGAYLNVKHTHEVYGGPFRKASIENGCYVYFCPSCHNMSRRGIHFSPERMERLRARCQMAFERTHSHDEFMAIFDKNYI